MAVLLGRVSDLKAESTLYSLTFDKDEYVKLEAVDSLAIGKTLLSRQRLRKICFSENSYLRFYGVQSYCDVYFNMCGVDLCTKTELLNFLDEIEERERAPFVLASIYKCKVICGEYEAAHRLIQMHVTAIETVDYHLLTPVYNLLSELKDCIDSSTVLKTIRDYMSGLE